MIQRTPTQPDVVEAGRVLATLDDWRAIMFVLVFVIVFLIIFIVWREWTMVRERREMRELASSFALSAGTVANTLGELSTKIAVLSALTARAEASIAKSTMEDSYDTKAPSGK